MSSSVPAFDKSGLLKEVLDNFKLNPLGIHGTNHWARVRRHGLSVAERLGGDVLVVELFAFLHDSQRQDDDRDPGHGSRAADYAASLNGHYYDLSNLQLDQLTYAIRRHSKGDVHQDPTIQSCWDGDRLDLVRLGYHPDPFYLSEEATLLIGDAWKAISFT